MENELSILERKEIIKDCKAESLETIREIRNAIALHEKEISSLRNDLNDEYEQLRSLERI